MKKKPESYAGYFRPHFGKVLIAFLLSALSSVGTFCSTHVLSTFVDQISIAKTFGTLAILIGTWLLLEVISKITTFGSSRLLLAVQSKVQHQIKWRIAGKLAEASIESVGKRDPVTLAENASEDVNRFMDSIHCIYQEVFAVLLGIAALVYSAVISWQIFLMFIISFAVILFVHFSLKQKMGASQAIARSSTMDTKYLLVQVIQAFADIKVQNLTRGIKPHLSDAMDKEVRENVKANQVFINSSLISGVLSLLSQAVFLVLATILILNNKLTVANFIALYLYRHYIYGLADASLRIIKSKAQLDTAKERMDTIFRHKSVTKQVWGRTHLENPTGNVFIQNVTACYDGNTVLDGLSVELPANSFIGIVGESGCGKSTLLKVLTKGLPYTGQVWLDGFELSSLTEHSHRKAISLAPQQPFLFDFSIKQNLLLGNPKATDDEIWECLKRCAADEFVREKGGLDTTLTPKELSGGQRQRLALARLHLRGGKIILMDESTSALDGESQSIVIDTIRDAANMGHTMVLVAHRVSTLKSADIILLMDKGKVVAQGTYAELYQKSEKFRVLANLG